MHVTEMYFSEEINQNRYALTVSPLGYPNVPRNGQSLKRA